MGISNLDGAVAMVTGASNGIGAGVSRRLASQGVRVVLADVDEAAGQALADELGGAFVACDVRELEDNQRAVAIAVEAFGRLDVVHLNAGVTTGCGVGDDFDLVKYNRAMAINLDGVVLGVHAALPALLDNGGGVVIATASMAGLIPVALEPIYSANKFAVVGLMRSLGALYGPQGIAMHALCPSFAETALITDIKPFLTESGFPILEVDHVVDAFMDMVASPGTGECWFVVPGRDSEPFRFRNAPGPRADLT